MLSSFSKWCEKKELNENLGPQFSSSGSFMGINDRLYNALDDFRLGMHNALANYSTRRGEVTDVAQYLDKLQALVQNPEIDLDVRRQIQSIYADYQGGAQIVANDKNQGLGAQGNRGQMTSRGWEQGFKHGHQKLTRLMDSLRTQQPQKI